MRIAANDARFGWQADRGAAQSVSNGLSSHDGMQFGVNGEGHEGLQFESIIEVLDAGTDKSWAWRPLDQFEKYFGA
jgi:hypothetical protein